MSRHTTCESINDWHGTKTVVWKRKARSSAVGGVRCWLIGARLVFHPSLMRKVVKHASLNNGSVWHLSGALLESLHVHLSLRPNECHRWAGWSPSVIESFILVWMRRVDFDFCVSRRAACLLMNFLFASISSELALMCPENLFSVANFLLSPKRMLILEAGKFNFLILSASIVLLLPRLLLIHSTWVQSKEKSDNERLQRHKCKTNYGESLRCSTEREGSGDEPILVFIVQSSEGTSQRRCFIHASRKTVSNFFISSVGYYRRFRPVPGGGSGSERNQDWIGQRSPARRP